ncbi:MAG TPA: ISL3 family transposase [Acidobacteriota bacterium]|nr:ISL3 family transposase [Acidobacteriota bacterium]
MSTSLLYHAFGLQGYVHQRAEYVGGEVHFHAVQPAKRLRCAACRSRRVIRRGARERRFRGLPIGSRRVWIVLEVPRLECKDCGVVRQAEVSFAPGQHGYTKRFARYVLELARHMTMTDVAHHLGVSWNLVKALLKEDLQRRFGRPSLKGLRFLAIDEISIGHGHRYLTVVLDLESGVVVFLGEGKGAKALDPFWRRLRRFGARIEAVAIDMSQAYIHAVRLHLPRATLVFDPFHVVKLMNDKLSDLRRELQRQATSEEKAVLKGTRWLLLKDPGKLDPSRKEAEHLEAALQLNAPLAAAYYLKEDLRQLWKQPNKASATRFLDAWIARARTTGLRQLVRMANTLSVHRQGLLAHYDVPISTGPLEGINNKIKTLQRQAYGFRDKAFFRLRIYALHETRYALIG